MSGIFGIRRDLTVISSTAHHPNWVLGSLDFIPPLPCLESSSRSVSVQPSPSSYYNSRDRAFIYPRIVQVRRGVTMASYQQPQHQQTSRRPDPRQSVHSLDSSWIITELARATNENVFSDTLSSPLSYTRHSTVADSDAWAEQVRCPQPFSRSLRANILP